MVPGFSVKALDALLPTLDETETGWGWGLDSLWPKLLGYEGVGIIDGTPVLHTRPVGRMRDADLAARVHAESDRILADHDCRQEHCTFGTFDADLRPRALPPERLLRELVRGWDYLIERDPRVLAWIMAYQQPHFEWPAYPVAGTPDQLPAPRPADAAAPLAHQAPGAVRRHVGQRPQLVTTARTHDPARERAGGLRARLRDRTATRFERDGTDEDATPGERDA
jgi:hypothetical protein